MLEEWLGLPARVQVVKRAVQEGGTLNFRDQMFSWRELVAAPGHYIVGFVVDDLGGNHHEVLAPLNVEY